MCLEAVQIGEKLGFNFFLLKVGWERGLLLIPSRLKIPYECTTTDHMNSHYIFIFLNQLYNVVHLISLFFQ